MKTDLQLHRDVAAELEWDPQLRDAEIGVAVKDGVVTLSGHLTTLGAKISAQRAAQRVAGVKGLADEIEVKPDSVFHRSDTDIAHAALSAFKWSSAVPADAISVKVDKGWLSISGKVAYWYQSDAAERTARSLVGVRGVTNLIQVVPPATERSITSRIEDAFERSARIDAKAIKVEMKDGKVTLRGKVQSWAERRDAERAAWSAPGVKAVEDHLLVTS